MDIYTPLAIALFSALIHASFQLSVSVLTLMSGHAIGARRSHAALMRLTGGFVFGAGVMTLLLVSTISLTLQAFFADDVPRLAWAVITGLLFGLGLAVWIFYYRRGEGTTLWVPRGVARFLSDRSKRTKATAESFSLGLTSVITELLFIFAPIVVASLALITLPPLWQLVGALLYTVVSLLSLLAVSALIGGGHKLSDIQRWRESNKKFLQFSSALGLLILGVYVYVNEIVAVAAATSGN